MALPSDPLSITHTWTLILTTIAACVAGTVLLVILRFLRRDLHLQDLQGPVDSASWLYGNLPELLLSQPYGKFEFKWQEQYGSTFRFKGCFSEDFLFTSDPVALRYILNDHKLFDFTPNRNFAVTVSAGEKSMLSLQNGGETHRRIKNAFSSVFTPARLQPYVPVMRDIARKVSVTSLPSATEKLMRQYSEGNEQFATIDIYHLLSHVTTDITGEVGFGYKFNAVETDGKGQVVQSHQNIVILGSRRSKGAVLGEGIVSYLPRVLLKPMYHLPTADFTTLRSFLKVTRAWGAARLSDTLKAENDTDNGLFGFVASANLKTQKEGRLSDVDLIGEQTPTLLVAGQDTVANSLSWAIYELAKRPSWQDQVRKEIMETNNTAVDINLDKLKYLNAHIKESLRFSPTVPLTERMAFEDTVLPLSRPLTTTTGVITEVPIRKGQIIHLGLAAFNRNRHVWGLDAIQFHPTRWLDGRYDAGNLPSTIGPYSRLRSQEELACVSVGGWGVILEMQVVLVELLTNFRFSLTPEQENNVTSSLALTLVPFDMGSGTPRLSLLVQPVTQSA
ncbi:cytochrome P450 [Marasmius fiardii PR-910]|nr:cytochrome P450 [Marasmius fiardii PR-910]